MEEVTAYYSLTRKAFDFLAPFYNVMTLPLMRVRNQVVVLQIQLQAPGFYRSSH